ncbi:MAG: Sapep family Mn(2+)-dependent dipeptidase [Bacillota bacterium]
MNAKVDAFIRENERGIVRAVQDALRFESVKEEPAGKGKPFGAPMADCLGHTLRLAGELGLATKNLDGYAGIAECGEGKEMLGILCHLDVVPAGTGWKYPPFGAQIEDGLIYGRGALDDKGPAISALFALAAVKQAGVSFRRRARLILGCDEESGWACMRRYKETEPAPDLAFSPDADYPLVYSEKGIVHLTFEKGFSSKLAIDAGTRPNVVAGVAEAIVPLDEQIVRAAMEKAGKEAGIDVSLERADRGTLVTVKGLEAHASTPEQGKNALLALFELLSPLPLPEADAALVRSLNALFGRDLHGEHLGLDREDETGRTTVNPGVMRWDASGVREFVVDIRCPRSLSVQDAQDTLAAALSPLGLAPVSRYIQPYHSVKKDSELVVKLLGAYEQRAGERLPPLAIGGGTYARAFENAVAFGCERPGKSSPVHMPNEFISVEDVLFNTYMIADAILALCT